MARTRLSDQEGFTLIEVLVASVVLVLGVLTAFRLVDAANATTSVNSARIGATNLSRELVEYARGTDYDQLQPLTLETALRQRPAVAGSGSPWTVTRRGVQYKVTSTVCTFDDPKDGLAATAPDNACPAAAADPNAKNPDGTPKVDQNPDDFRRVTIRLNWTTRGRTGSMTQSALIVNPAGGLGPRITAFDEPSGDQGPGVTSVSWGGTLKLTSTKAAGVHWTTSNGGSQGDAGGGPTSWAFTWNLGTDKANPLTVDGTWVLDGNYTVQAQALDSRGIPGEARVITLHVNRHAPGPVSGFDGGYNERFGGVVDLHWTRYPENDVRGYRVYRDGITPVCPASGSGYITANTCTDPNPGLLGLAHVYTVKAVDCEVLSAATCTPREGVGVSKAITLNTGSAPQAPGPITATVVDGLPKLTWSAVGSARFYRIYRDTGTGLADRYDETSTSSPTYTDPNPGSTTQHTYWVTAVDGSFDESAPSAPVTSPGP